MRQRFTILTIFFLAFSCVVFAQEKGKASYYSKRFTGARTASGARLNNDSLVCAHRTYPFGTKLIVKNVTNGKEVVVKVIDRGPHVRGRIIDLSYAAAKQLGIIAQGIGVVEVSVYHEYKGIPYPAEPADIPEFDFELMQPDSVPAWKYK